MEKFHDHLTTVYSKSNNGMYILGGDMNLTCIDWDREIILTEQTNSTRDLNHCTTFLETISEIGVSQHCKIITRPISGKILDLMLTNRPDTVVDVSVYPGMSDHNVVIGTFNLITSRTRKPQRKILKFNQTDWTEVRKAAADVTTAYMARQPNNHTVQENGTFIETHLLSLIEKHVPTKMSKSKQTYPWITPEIKKNYKESETDTMLKQ